MLKQTHKTLWVPPQKKKTCFFFALENPDTEVKPLKIDVCWPCFQENFQASTIFGGVGCMWLFSRYFFSGGHGRPALGVFDEAGHGCWSFKKIGTLTKHEFNNMDSMHGLKEWGLNMGFYLSILAYQGSPKYSIEQIEIHLRHRPTTITN